MGILLSDRSDRDGLAAEREAERQRIATLQHWALGMVPPQELEIWRQRRCLRIEHGIEGWPEAYVYGLSGSDAPVFGFHEHRFATATDIADPGCELLDPSALEIRCNFARETVRHMKSLGAEPVACFRDHDEWRLPLASAVRPAAVQTLGDLCIFLASDAFFALWIEAQL